MENITNNKKLVGAVATLGALCIFIVTIAIITTTSPSGKKQIDKTLMGKYELKELSTTKGDYTPEKLKEELGRSIRIEVTKDKFIKTTTYYSVDGRTSDSIESYSYDREQLFDPEANNLAFYSYSLVDGKLILKNLEVEETMVFLKQ